MSVALLWPSGIRIGKDDAMKKPTSYHDVLLASFLLVAALWLNPAPLSAQDPFTLPSPPLDSELVLGEPIVIRWSGGDAAWNVNVSLIEVTPGLPFAVARAVGTFPNTQRTVTWNLPETHPLGGPCEHLYVMYVEEARQVVPGTPLMWGYGPTFKASCRPAVFTKIVDTDTLTPGSSLDFDYVYPYVSVNSGHAAFQGYGTRPDGTRFNGVYTAEICAGVPGAGPCDPSVLPRIDNTTPLPGGGQFYNAWSPSTDGGDFAAAANGRTSDGQYQYGIFADTGSGLGLEVGRGTPIPDGSGGVFNYAYNPSLQGGDIAFLGRGGNTYRGVFSKIGGSLLKVTTEDDVVPGGDGSRFYYFCSPSTDNGVTAVGGYNRGSSYYYRTGIYSREGASLRVVADYSTALPGEGGNFTYINYCSAVVDNGQIAFSGQGRNADGLYRRGIYAEQLEASSGIRVLTKIVDDASPTPPDVKSLYYPYYFSLDDGNIAFSSSFRDVFDRYRYYGLFLIHEGDPIKILAHGSMLEGQQVQYLYSFKEALDGGDVGFGVYTRKPNGSYRYAIYVASLDRDGDGIPEDTDNCSLVANSDQLDTDGNGVGDACQDSDGDTILDAVDNCPFFASANQADGDGDGLGDVCDNCVAVANFLQENLDGDALGNACDPDDDEDTWLDEIDNCPLVSNDQSDIDTDGLGDVCDPDIDGDGIQNAVDGFHDASGDFTDESAIASDNFTDRELVNEDGLVGFSFGRIKSSGGLVLQVDDHNDPTLGLQIDAIDGSGKATLEVCDYQGKDSQIKLDLGDSAEVTCGSVSVKALTDQIELELVDGSEVVVIEVPNAVIAKVDDVAPGVFEVTGDPTNPDNVYVTLGDVKVAVPAAATAVVTEIGGNQFQLDNSEESLQAIVAETGGETIPLEPGSGGVFELDGLAPLATNVSAVPSPASTAQGIVISATLDDSTTGAASLDSAEYEVRDMDGNWVAGEAGGNAECPSSEYLCPVGGDAPDFDAVTEGVEVSIPAAAVAALGPGVYEACVRGTDANGHTGDFAQEGACAFVVIYDPEGGFVTGGGWIDSPEGAFKDNNALIGKANFGFVSKYKKGQQTPDGQTQFQFKAGDLSFHSSSYEWLVIAGPLAQYKGDGTVNGEGNFGFLLTAKDSSISGGPAEDTFRIKIWDKNNGDATIYDNGTNQPLGGGSIVIHTKGN